MLSSTSNQEPRKVRALYDFEAAEDNELTFAAGDIIHVLDDSDPNWWKGYNRQGEGLFPSNFVTADLSVEPEKLDINQKNKKTVQFEIESKDNENTEVIKDKSNDDKSYVPEINEEKIDRLLHLLHEANPEDPSQDSEEMLRLEEQVDKMGPLIDAELERVDRKHAQLTQLSSDLVDAINLYHTLMREPDRSNIPPHNMMGGMIFPGYNNVLTSQNLYNPALQGVYGMPNIYPPTATLPAMPAGGVIHTSLQSGGGPLSQQPMTSISQMPIPIETTVSSFAIPHRPQMIPMQYQNGHVPPPPFSPNQHQQQQQPSQFPLQNQSQASSNNQQIQIPQVTQLTSPQTQQMQQQPQQQQQSSQPTTQQPSASTQIPNASYLPSGGIYSTPQSVNAISTNIPPAILSPGLYHMPQQPPSSLGMIGNVMPSYNNEGHPSHLAAINQPVTHTILGQNDSKTTIPLHQQR